MESLGFSNPKSGSCGPARLRNACDACHRLKRRCTGAMPCGNCVATGASCFYSVAGRLGRPRGSRSRRNVEHNTTPSSPTSASQPYAGFAPRPKLESRPSLVHRRAPSSQRLDQSSSASDEMREDWNLQTHHNEESHANIVFGAFAENHTALEMDIEHGNHTSNVEFDSMLMMDPDLDHYDAASFYKLSTGPTSKGSSKDQGLSLYVSSSDAVQHLTHSPVLHSSASSTSTSRSITGSNPSDSVARSPTSQRLVASHQQQPERAYARQQSEPRAQASDLMYHKEHRMRTTSPSPSQPEGLVSRTSCQCTRGLSTLLHNLIDCHSEKPQLDSLLFRVSDALDQWSVLAACQRCQSAHEDDDEDDGEILLLAAMGMRRVIAQIKNAQFHIKDGPSVKRGNAIAATEGDVDSRLGEHHPAIVLGDSATQVRIGSFEVKGSDRNMLLSVFRTIILRKLDAAVTTMRSMLRTRQAQATQRRKESAVVTLNHIGSLLDELTESIKGLH